MKSYWKFAFTFGLVGYFLACSPVRFDKLPAPKCQGSGENCVSQNGVDTFSPCKTVGDGQVDILIVNDNSGSMSFEQSKVAERFSTFIDSLGDLDYQIAMITTDVSSRVSDTPNNFERDANGNGKFQDGAFLEFDDGLRILRRDTPNKVQLFADAVERDETRKCEDELRAGNTDPSACPSGDERGIFAANLALERNELGFFRPGAHLAIIFLADEDERSGVYDKAGYEQFQLQTKDLPETLISTFKAKYPRKTLSVHSIIVQEGDTACFDEQKNQNGLANVRGSYGLKYAELSTLTGGEIGDICADDYGQQLGDIGYTIQEQVTSMPLACRPTNDQYDIEATLNGQPITLDHEANFSALRVDIRTPLPPTTRVCMKYTCKSLQN